jgi:hypothetical protein
MGQTHYFRRCLSNLPKTLDARNSVSEKTTEAVEKVGVELIATTNRASNAPNPACLVPDLGRKRVPREFFNSLTYSRQLMNIEGRGRRPRPSSTCLLI